MELACWRSNRAAAAKAIGCKRPVSPCAADWCDRVESCASETGRTVDARVECDGQTVFCQKDAPLDEAV